MSAPPLRFYSFVLAVADLDVMRGWYGRVLGMSERLSGASPADGTRFAVLEGAGTRVELVEQRGAMVMPPPEPPAHLRATGWKTLDLETDDLAALDGHLRSEGVVILQSIHLLSSRRAVTTVRDPEGNLVAFFGPVPG